MKRAQVREQAAARSKELARRHDDDKVSMTELGRELGVSRARISQIIKRSRPKAEQPA